MRLEDIQETQENKNPPEEKQKTLTPEQIGAIIMAAKLMATAGRFLLKMIAEFLKEILKDDRQDKAVDDVVALLQEHLTEENLNKLINLLTKK